MNADKLSDLHIASEDRKRPQRPMWVIFIGVIVVVAIAIYFAWPRASDSVRVKNGGKISTTNAAVAASASTASATSSSTIPSTPVETKPAASGDVVLTVSGYIINRERIELS